MQLSFPGLHMEQSNLVILIQSQKSLYNLSSAVVGGGFSHTRYWLVTHVDKDYANPNPAEDLVSIAHQHGINELFVGMLTAAYLTQSCAVSLTHHEIEVCMVVTAGLSNGISAGDDLPISSVPPGTINCLAYIDANLTSAAMVNAVITMTEAKTAILRENNIRTPGGYTATGTSTDVISLAVSGKGEQIDYSGPITPVGWLLAKAVRQALSEIIIKLPK